MLFFSKPCDQDRLNATVFELVHMKFNGSVTVEGCWDACCALDYLEKRMKTGLLPTLNEDGTLFFLRGKYVQFSSHCVLVTTVRPDIIRFCQA
jgi:hypothetical protein